MDTLISSSLEEICYHGPTGLSLSTLWSKLTPTPSSPSIKFSLWTNLLSIPSLYFTLPGNDTPVNPDDTRIQRFEDAEKLDLNIIAKDHLTDSFVGLYDTPSTGISSNQRNVLRRLAVSRGDGITQNFLAKELGILNNRFFYVVRSLECRGLIVRQPAVVKTKDNASVTTNLLYLYRHAKHLGVQQRFEINEECVMEDMDEGRDDFDGDSLTSSLPKENVFVRDYLPAMKAICDKLEEANDKVLVVSDIKQDLGYCGAKGHRAWRNIFRRLKDACIVEEFEAKVDGKVVCCIRLLKKFSPKNFESGEDCNNEVLAKFGKMIGQTDQLVELSLDQQIYDLIDAAGTKGITFTEVFRRLGLDKKRNYPRLENMVSSFGMRRQAEINKRTPEYRIWTAGNSSSNTLNAFPCTSKNIPSYNDIPNMDTGNIDVPVRSDGVLEENINSTLAVDFVGSGKPNSEEVNIECSHGSSEDGKTDDTHLCSGIVPESFHGPRGTASNTECDLVSMDMEIDGTSSEKVQPPLSKSPYSESSQPYPNVPLTVDSALREQRVLEWLQEKRFILKVELHKWLKIVEEDKGTTIDRKTVDRMLCKLERQGHCKLQHINLPVVTNCERYRIIPVVLHPSVQSFLPDLVGEIHDRFRLFEKQSRGEGSSRVKTNESVPVLNDVTRIQVRVGSDEKAAKFEAMRANGFVLAKMVRARMLHVFLWDHLRSLPEWNGGLSSGADSCTYKLFALEAVIKAIPIELFLQVAGSAQKYDDMVEKCKGGLRLSDLPVEEYKKLMGTGATSRLSWIIDILRRLKLIRLVCDGHSEDGVKVPHATSRHAMELKPYIEEPLPIVAISNLRSLDVRPRIRHDFVLSNREAVDEYWKTLEYCYAASHQIAAKHAFPGYVVPEVFHPRSWTSIRVMSADQRAELLRRIVTDDLSKTLSYNDCEKIAKDLNLTLQQVLRVYYDKHHQRLNRFQGLVNASEEHPSPKKLRASSSKKRKKSLESSSMTCRKADNIDVQLEMQELTKLADNIDQLVVDKDLSYSEHDDNLPEHQEDEHQDTLEEPGSYGDEECHSMINQCAFSKMKPTRQSRFSWTDEADRQLVIQYVRRRAVLGPKIHRVDWNALSDLPADPGICSRRMSTLLRQNAKFRTAVLKLCTMLGERYAKHLEKTQNSSLNNDCRALMRCSTQGLFSKVVECNEKVGSKEEYWDDFEDKSVRKAFEDVLRWKQMGKSEVSKKGAAAEEWFDLNTNVDGQNHMESVPSNTPNEKMQNLSLGKRKDAAQRSRHYRLHQKFVKLLNERTSVNRQVHKSLAISSAVELLKLVFLSTSTAPELQNLLAETLRHYSEHDLFAAFSYLREKKIMIGGSAGLPFVLSQQFLHNLSKSPFPSNAGKRAAKFSSWLHEREEDLLEGGAHLNADLQCGDIFHLFALVSSGELSISPCTPDEGVGEAEDQRSLKRKAEEGEFCDVEKVKKLKSLTDSEFVSRREKGFPGIVVSVCRAAIPSINSVHLLNDSENCGGELHWNDMSNATMGQEIISSAHNCGHGQEIPNVGSIIPTATWSSKSPWEAMTCYLEYLVSETNDQNQLDLINPEVFRALYAAIQKAGDQGLTMEEVSQIVGLSGENIHLHIVDVLQAFRRILKVNAYDTVRVVDSLYCSKYFLTSLAGSHQDPKTHSVMKFLARIDDGHPVSRPENHVVGTSSRREVYMGDHEMHKITILNFPEEPLPLNEHLNSIMHDRHLQEKKISPELGTEDEIYSGELVMPILPWINGDGAVNKVVYDRLVRRVLGIVMQNPAILEENIIQRLDVLNPQSCRKLLELMILDKHLIVRKMHQSTSSSPPALLETFHGNSFREPKSIYREHFFANPMSAFLL